ncbi:MAG: hypothetical protein Q7T45_09765 [Bradyrhizobium sp.]|uniref:hypothetical protein n=1 Tax=Bradyrhizobium sp. TaxID=376 RepID=UPI002722AFF1|nr:hypothetical protein [Bradyrhizobium sp.]MDO8398094.1 hypothetical protein [Bradyrhizobium sp.]
MIVLGKLDDVGRARLEAAVARVRAYEVGVRAACGHGVFKMAASDSIEKRRAGQNARSAARNYRNKNSLGRVVATVPKAGFIDWMLRTGWYPRPREGPPTFAGAVAAHELMLLAVTTGKSITRDNKNLRDGATSGKVGTKDEESKA